jgi:hypothetical protein
MTPKLEKALWAGVDALDDVGLRYAIVGGLAVGAWGHPRATRDVDLYAELPDQARPRLRKALETRGFDVPAMEEELTRFGVFRSRLVGPNVFLDIFDAVGPLGDAILERRVLITVGNRDLNFISASDLAVLKAFSDRRRDYDDLVSLLKSPAASLDVAYVERWAVKLDESIGGNDVTERLRQASAQAAKT